MQKPGGSIFSKIDFIIVKRANRTPSIHILNMHTVTQEKM